MSLKIRQLNYKDISTQYGFFHPNKGSTIVRNISPLKTRNFLCFFQHLKKNIYKVIICFSPELTVFKTLILSGFRLNIKRFVYRYMLNHEDNRMRGWSSKC